MQTCRQKDKWIHIIDKVSKLTEKGNKNSPKFPKKHYIIVQVKWERSDHFSSLNKSWISFFFRKWSHLKNIGSFGDCSIEIIIKSIFYKKGLRKSGRPLNLHKFTPVFVVTVRAMFWYLRPELHCLFCFSSGLSNLKII